jgi:thiol-disulfide isomerase/thioredoxin
VLPLLLFLSVACTGGGDPDEIEEVSIPFPGLQGESVVDGSPLNTEQFSGDVLVVNAWASWCGPCKQEQPALLRVLDRYEDRGVSFLGIDHIDDRASATRWIEEDYDVPYPSLFDPAGEFAAALGYPGVPATYVVDRSDTIRFRSYGPITERMLTEMLERVLAG